MTGVGFITSSPIRLRFVPAAADTGVLFQRTDLKNASPIPARVESVTGTSRRTTLGSGSNQITLVEHILSALAGLRIDNCLVELDGPEPPGLDGSSREFVEVLLSAGVGLQTAMRPVWTTSVPIRVSQNGATLTIHPESGSDFKMSYFLNYGHRSSIPPQMHTEIITPETYASELASSRTFVLEAEVAELQEQGIGKHLTAKDLLVFGERGPIDNQLRFANEPARHKVLDLVGDLALCGFDLAGHVVAYRSGHPLNIELARALTQAARNAASPVMTRRAA